MNGHRKSFHEAMKARIPSTAIPGRTIGNTIANTVRVRVALSTRAASISSSGTDWLMNCRMKETPNGVTAAGRITEARLSTGRART